MEKIIDKIRKLLALAKSDNVNEAAAAAARAQAIIDNHKIDLALLQEEEQHEEQPEEPVRRCLDFPLFAVARRIPAWKWDLAWSLCDANQCRPWSSTEYDEAEEKYARVCYVIGRTGDAQTVQYLHQYLAHEIDRLAKTHSGKGRTWLNNFRLGAVSEIERRLKLKKRYDRKALTRSAAESGDSTALVKMESALARIEAQDKMVDKWMEAQDDMKYSSNSSDVYHDPDGFEQGRTAGASVSLGAGKTRALGTGS